MFTDLPKGPLDQYRSNSSCCWKKMKLYLDPPEIIEYTNNLYKTLEEDPVFQYLDPDKSLEEVRHDTFLKAKRIIELINTQELFQDYRKASATTAAIGSYDWSLLARKSLLVEFIQSTLVGLGTKKHLPYVQKLEDLEIGGAFCLTEIGHGTNTKQMKTKATYDIETESFILHTPDFQAAKCWAGNLAKTATHGVVFAQLYTPDNVCYGLHTFLVPIRDPKTLLTYPGVTIMDMGHKLGLNGVDNGVMMFENYSIPKDMLLNKTGDVTLAGNYQTPYKDPNKRFGASLGNLSIGRVGIIGFGVVNLKKALTIAVRYSAVRRQFGPSPTEEIPIIEYPLQQWRLFPYLAATYALDRFSKIFHVKFFNFRLESFDGTGTERMAMYGQEVHALSSAGKPISGWLARDAIQECREACGGHGYLSASGFGNLRNDNDANLTYEGDNNVLLQQTSNWLMTVWNNRKKQSCKHPMATVDYMDHADAILDKSWSTSPLKYNSSDTEVISICLEALQWLVCYLCSQSVQKLQDLKKSGIDNFTAKNSIQVYLAHTLSIVYVENVIVDWFNRDIYNADDSLKPTLYKLCSLFALFRLNKHISYLLQGGLLKDSTFVTEVNERIKRLCKKILPEAVSLVDAVAPPDFVLRSVLGNSDGKVYDHLKTSMMTAPGSLSRATKWQEMSYKQKSKL